MRAFVSPRFATRLLAAVLALVLTLVPGRGVAQVHDVDPRSFPARLAAAGPGTVLRLAPGDYGVLGLDARSNPSFRFPAQVTIASADPQNPATFSGLSLRDVTNLAFEGLVFDYTYAPGHPIWQRPFNVQGGSGIRFENNEFNGDVAQGLSAVADGFGYAFGLSIRNVTGVVIEGNEFHTWYRGLYVDNSDDVVVRGNEVHNIRSDGMNFAAVQRVVIEDNHIHSFRASLDSGDHRDMIQFWTNGTTRPSTDIVIRGNRLLAGTGAWTQSIFIRNEQVDLGRAGPEMFYRNLRIEENFIHNAHLHGITVGETRGLIIRRNTLVRNPAAEGPERNPPLWTPMIRVSPHSERVVIEANAVARITGPEGQPDWHVADNLLVQDRTRTEAHHYSRVFAGLDPTDPASFVPRPGGPLDGTGIGVPP